MPAVSARRPSSPVATYRKHRRTMLTPASPPPMVVATVVTLAATPAVAQVVTQEATQVTMAVTTAVALAKDPTSIDAEIERLRTCEI